MPCAIEKIIMAEVSGNLNVINVFHDVNSILYTIANFTKMLSLFFVVKT